MPDWLVIVLLFFLWCGIALTAHILDRRYYLVSVYAAVTMVVVTQVVSYLETGHWDPLWFVSVITTFCLGFILAMLVGLPFRFSRMMKSSQEEVD
jgi:hypothetical protein